MEEDLRLAMRGADYTWLEDAHAEDITQEAHGLELPPEALERLALMKQMEEEGGLAGLEDVSDYLRSHVQARLLNHRLGQPDAAPLLLGT
eukprot:11645040-Heterocapsa_arctica.AAC.1